MEPDDFAFTHLEVKFAEGSPAGAFEGYGAIFNSEDEQGDLIVPGAFKKSLKERRAQGRSLPMYAMHGFRLGADPLPVGVWKAVEEDEKGLKVAGEIGAMDTDHGRRIYSLVKSGALGGLSIGYRVAEGGAVFGSKVGEPRRTLKQVDLVEVSIVDDPAHAKARVTAVKSRRLTAALDDFAMRLRDGKPPEIKEFEDILREAGVPKSMAVQIASVGYAKAVRSESDGAKAIDAAAIASIREAVHGFLPVNK